MYTGSAWPGHSHWAGMLRAIFVARRAVDTYIELAERTELSSTDCLTIARMLVSKRKPDAALSWVERGIAIGEKHSPGASHELPELPRALLVKLGRAEEAADDAWSDYRAWPSCFTYETVMYYYAALDHFEHARRCYARVDMHLEWDVLVETIRSDHFRKSGFMLGFEHVVRGRRQPRLQDRARESWKR